MEGPPPERDSTPSRVGPKNAAKIGKTPHRRHHAINAAMTLHGHRDVHNPAPVGCTTTGMFPLSKNCNCGTSTVFRRT